MCKVATPDNNVAWRPIHATLQCEVVATLDGGAHLVVLETSCTMCDCKMELMQQSSTADGHNIIRLQRRCAHRPAW